MNITILVVDDEEMITEMLSRHFRFLDYNVETALNGLEAVQILRQQRVDIVISDVMMPEMNGIELLREINANYPMTHAIMITGYVELEHALNCMELGADTILFKPLEDLKLLEQAVLDAVTRIQHWFNIISELRKMRPK